MKTEMRTGTEGPQHDPYGWTEYVATPPNGEWCKLRLGALGYTRLIFKGQVADEAYADRDGVAAAKLVARFEAYAGTTLDRIAEDYYGEEEDPMGPASRYI
jgi:uncharacterized membrane-anchored protein